MPEGRWGHIFTLLHEPHSHPRDPWPPPLLRRPLIPQAPFASIHTFTGIVMEYIDGQDLQQYVIKQGGSLPEDVARFVFQQLVIAVDFIHR